MQGGLVHEPSHLLLPGIEIEVPTVNNGGPDSYRVARISSLNTKFHKRKPFIQLSNDKNFLSFRCSLNSRLSR